MTPGRYVVLGLAPPRSPWFQDVSRWATAGSLPIEFVKCLSIDDLQARIESGRVFSAALLDGRLPSVDRDLIAELAERDIAAIVVDSGRSPTDWLGLDAAAQLSEEIDRTVLFDALASHGRLIKEVTDQVAANTAEVRSIGLLNPLVALIGRPGAGVSTLSIALAQQLARDPRFAPNVLLVDLDRHAHQAVLHDTRDIMPGIQEVMDLHRTGTPTPEELESLTYRISDHGYRLLLGLRHPRDWVTVRARALTASLDSLRRMSRIVIADTDPELEGEAETGSFDIEDRHLLGRRTTASADLVVLVTRPTLTGMHEMAFQLEQLRHHGIAGERVLVVLNRAPRSPRARAESVHVVNGLTRNRDHPSPHLGPVFLPDRRGVEAAFLDSALVHASVREPLASAVLRALTKTEHDRRSFAEPIAEQPVRVAPGSLGRRPEEDP